MSDEKSVLSALTRPGSVRFKSNEAAVEAIKGQIPILNKINENGSTYWCIQDQPGIQARDRQGTARVVIDSWVGVI